MIPYSPCSLLFDTPAKTVRALISLVMELGVFELSRS